MRLAVVGTGLIGSSFALGARRAGVFESVVGIEPDAGRADRALTLGVIDAVADDVPADVDAVLLAGPSHTIADWVVRLTDHPGILFDAGSVKAPVLEAARRSGGLPRRFVPCHPLAGSERSGPDAARPDLFADAEVIVTPAPETDREALVAVAGWWQALGARVTEMGAEDHDRVLAVTSHLPHLVAFAYLQQITDEHRPHTAGGFRDFTRIGAADADMWAPIFQLNREAVLTALDELERSLGEVRDLIGAGDADGLAAFIRRAAARRGGTDD